MGYTKLTNKKMELTETIVIRIGYKTLVMIRKMFPGKKNESAAKYFYRLAAEIKRLKNLEEKYE